jgi:hypothetical protein
VVLTDVLIVGRRDVDGQSFAPIGLHKTDAASDWLLINSNSNASETKANESFDNGVFFDIEAKRTPSLESKLFLKRSEHIR